jgi:hypothetical protein
LGFGVSMNSSTSTASFRSLKDAVGLLLFQTNLEANQAASRMDM